MIEKDLSRLRSTLTRELLNDEADKFDEKVQFVPQKHENETLFQLDSGPFRTLGNSREFRCPLGFTCFFQFLRMVISGSVMTLSQ